MLLVGTIVACIMLAPGLRGQLDKVRIVLVCKNCLLCDVLVGPIVACIMLVPGLWVQLDKVRFIWVMSQQVLQEDISL